MNRPRLINQSATFLLGFLMTLGYLQHAAIGETTALQAQSESSSLLLIPWPKRVKLGDGELNLTAATHIAVMTPSLKPLAKIIGDDLRTVTGLQLKLIDGPGAAGDIVLRLDPSLRADEDIITVRDRQITRVRDFAHQITITDRVVITGWDYRATAEGTATLLQLVHSRANQVTVPLVEIHDWPHADFTGAMVDTGRQLNSIEDLKKMVLLCRAYKVRYFDLHLTDDQGWTFPSTAFPQLGTNNSAAHGGPAPQRYDLAELRALVKFADDRGVTLIPELESPGHSGAARGILPAIFGYLDPVTGRPQDQGMMNLANPKLYPAMDTLIGEMLDVFDSSPYFDIGFDEVSGLAAVASTPQCVDFMKAKGLLTQQDLLKYFALSLNDMVKKRGRKTLLWEGAGMFSSPDMIVFAWDSNTRQAEQLLKQGIPVIVVPWGLGVPWPEWNMYVCNGSMLKRSDDVLGAVFPAWEQTGMVHTRWLGTIATRQERTWGPDNEFTEAGFHRRAVSTDAVTSKLLYGFNALHDGAIDADFFANRVVAPVTLRLDAAPGIGTIRFTTDGSNPTSSSSTFAVPIRISDSMTVKARLFGAAGETSWPIWEQPYVFDPLTVVATGLTKDSAGKDVPWFGTSAQITLHSGATGGTIHYTLDGTEPFNHSPVYNDSIRLTDTATINARWFDDDGTGRGKMLTSAYQKLATMHDAALGKPVTLLTPADIQDRGQVETLLTDGVLMRNDEWSGTEVAHFGKNDAELIVDLQAAVEISAVGGRFLYCQEMGIFPPTVVKVSTSQDGKNFIAFGEAAFSAPANPNDRGVTIKVLQVLGHTSARYVKVFAKNIGLIPAWHPVKGAPAHLMMDEVFVNPLNDTTINSK